MYRNENENPGNAKHQLGLFSEESLMSTRCLDTTTDENVATFNVRTFKRATILEGAWPIFREEYAKHHLSSRGVVQIAAKSV